MNRDISLLLSILFIFNNATKYLAGLVWIMYETGSINHIINVASSVFHVSVHKTFNQNSCFGAILQIVWMIAFLKINELNSNSISKSTLH